MLDCRRWRSLVLIGAHGNWRRESDFFARYSGKVTTPASKELLDLFVAVLTDLGTRHGLSNLRHGGAGTVVADVEAGRTYLDLTRFELEPSHS